MKKNLLIYLFCISSNLLSAQAFLLDTTKLTIGDTVIARNYLNEADNLYKKGKYQEMYNKADTARIIFEKLLGSDSRDVNEAMIYIGNAKVVLGNYFEAKLVFENILGKLLKSNGDSLAVANVYNNLGLTCKGLGEYKNAINFYYQAIKIRSQISHKNDSLGLADNYFNLGNCFRDIEEYDKAIDCHNKALEIRNFYLGGNSISVASSYLSIGNLHSQIGDLKKSLNFYNEALKIFIEKLGPEHRYCTFCYQGLGNDYFISGQYSKALDFQFKALNIKLMNKVRNDDLAQSFHNIAIIYSAISEFNKAEEYFNKSLKIYLEIGNDHPYIAMIFNGLAHIYERKGDFEQAEKYYLQSKEIQIKNLEVNDNLSSDIFFQLGEFYNTCGKYSDAIENSKKAIELNLRQSSGNKILSLVANNNIANSFRLIQNNDSSLVYFLRSLSENNYYLNDHSKIISEIDLAISLQGIAKLKFGQYIASNKIEDLDESLEYIKKAVYTTQHQVNSPMNSSPNLSWQDESIFDEALKLNFLKYKRLKKANLLLDVFQIFENSKANILHTQLKETDALNFAGIPDTILLQEFDLRVKITWRQKQKQNLLEEGKTEIDSNVVRISSTIFDLKQQYEEIKK